MIRPLPTAFSDAAGHHEVGRVGQAVQVTGGLQHHVFADRLTDAARSISCWPIRESGCRGGRRTGDETLSLVIVIPAQ